MSTNKKPRSDSALKTLPTIRQEAVAEYAREHSLMETVKWLAEDGVKTSIASLSEFLSWHSLSAQFRQDEVTTETLLKQLKAEIPGITEEQLDELGQRTFSLLAIRNQDLSGFVNVRSARTNAQIEKAKLKLRERAEDRQTQRLKLEERKVVMAEAKAKVFAAVEEVGKAKGTKLDAKTKKEILDAIDKKLLGEP